MVFQQFSKICDKTWSFFISLKLTFVILLVIIIGAIIGMGYDQTISFNEYINNSKESFLELNDAFHSWWFSLAILLLSLNLIACSIERLPKIYFDFKNPRRYLSQRRLLGLNLQYKKIFSNLVDADKSVKNFFGYNNIKLLPKFNEQEFFYYEKHKLGRFGVYVVHIALLIIMYSSIYANHYGVNGNVLIEEGQKTRFITAKGPYGIEYPYDLGFYIACDDFRLKTFVDNSPLEYESDLQVTNLLGQKQVAKTVRVNDPLTFLGFTFYQASFRPIPSNKVIEILIRDIEGKERLVKEPLNKTIQLSNDKNIRITSFYEDFSGLGQAIKIEENFIGKSPRYFHVFRRYPEFDRAVREDSYAITFLDVDQDYATGLSIGFVPGIEIIFFGFLLFLVGLFMCFFLRPTRYFLRKTNLLDGRVEVIFAASGFRHINLVREDFSIRCRRVDNLE